MFSQSTILNQILHNNELTRPLFSTNEKELQKSGYKAKILMRFETGVFLLNMWSYVVMLRTMESKAYALEKNMGYSVWDCNKQVFALVHCKFEKYIKIKADFWSTQVSTLIGNFLLLDSKFVSLPQNLSTDLTITVVESEFKKWK